jgi:hypothetical protein
MGFTDSAANATDGSHQVGFGYNGSNFHAVLWTATAASAVDLHPSNIAISDSRAFGVNNGQEVGWANGSGTGNQQHAMLWIGGSNVATDLHPTNLTGFVTSTAYDTNGTYQVGVGQMGDGKDRALLWVGGGDSTVDLQALLPNNFVSSEAYTIDSSNIVYGVATDSSGVLHEMEWNVATAVPEPGTIALAGVYAAGLLARRRIGLRK